EIVASEEVATALGRGITAEISILPRVGLMPRPTHVVDLRNTAINGTKTVLFEKGRGKIKELLIRSDSSNFFVDLEKDKEKIIYGTYNYYADISPHLQEIDAFEYNNIYTFKANDIEFSTEVVLKITASNVTFRNIFVKYELEESV
ncbi:MAG: hypothetical protein DRH17_12200, partial [Deltaproteobacteria bacterium]